MLHSNLINGYRTSQRGFSSDTQWRFLEFVYALFRHKYFSDYQVSFPNQAKFWEKIWLEWMEQFIWNWKKNNLNYNLKTFFVLEYLIKKLVSKHRNKLLILYYMNIILWRSLICLLLRCSFGSMEMVFWKLEPW